MYIYMHVGGLPHIWHDDSYSAVFYRKSRCLEWILPAKFFSTPGINQIVLKVRVMKYAERANCHGYIEKGIVHYPPHTHTHTYPIIIMFR